MAGQKTAFSKDPRSKKNRSKSANVVSRGPGSRVQRTITIQIGDLLWIWSNRSSGRSPFPADRGPFPARRLSILGVYNSARLYTEVAKVYLPLIIAKYILISQDSFPIKMVRQSPPLRKKGKYDVRRFPKIQDTQKWGTQYWKLKISKYLKTPSVQVFSLSRGRDGRCFEKNLEKSKYIWLWSRVKDMKPQYTRGLNHEQRG